MQMNTLGKYVTAALSLFVAAACQSAVVPSNFPSASVVPPSASASATSIATLAVATTSQTTAPTLQPTAPALTPEPTAQPTAQLTALPSTSPTADVTPEPTPEPAGLVIDWRERGGDHGFGTLFDDSQTATFHSGAVFANRYFIAGALEDEDFNEDRGLWSSADGLSWVREELPNMNEVYATAANAAGLVVVGGATVGPGMWLTINGSDWLQIVFSDAPDQWVSSVGATPAGFVAFGSSAWTSIDGVSWAPMIEPSALDLAAAGVVRLSSYGDRLMAVTGGTGGSVCCGPLVAWTSTDLVDWTQVATFAGTRNVNEPVLAGGPLGWIVAGYAENGEQKDDLMFASTDGLAWQQVTPPIGPVSDVFIDDAGFVAVGFLFVGTGCALDPSDIQGLTWTSVDGRSWTAMPQEEFLYKRIDYLFRDGRTLIGVGLSYDPEGGTSDNAGVWTAKLPPITPLGPGPTPAPTPTPEPGGCGPR
jgi:hypothetical protein